MINTSRETYVSTARKEVRQQKEALFYKINKGADMNRIVVVNNLSPSTIKMLRHCPNSVSINRQFIAC